MDLLNETRQNGDTKLFVIHRRRGVVVVETPNKFLVPLTSLFPDKDRIRLYSSEPFETGTLKILSNT